MKISFLSLGIFLAVGLQAQSDYMEPEGSPDLGDPCCIADGIPRTTEQMLERRGIQLTVQAVVNALLDPRPVVRSLAAAKLALDKEKDAIPAIVEAFSRETAAGTREFMADALASLGEAQGFETLRGMCSAGDSPRMLKLAAVRSLIRLHDESCVDSLLGLMHAEESSPPWTPARDSTLNAELSEFSVYQFHQLSESQVNEIRNIAARCLAGRSAEVRLTAARVLAKFGDAASIPLLRKAIDAEQDSFNRPRMLDALTALQDKYN
jgi:HEAT repeat protein